MDEIAKLYALFELDPGASQEDLKAAYLDLVKVWHPDRYARDSARLRHKAEQKLKAINLAYERLRAFTSGVPLPPQASNGEGAYEPAKTYEPPQEYRIATDLFASDFGERWGFVNRAGKLVIPPRYDFAEQFSEGLAHVAEAGLHGFIDQKGIYRIHPQFSNARSFSEGLAAVVFSVRWGYIDRHDRSVINPLFEDCGDFSEGLAAVRWRGRWGYIDKAGLYAIPPRFDEARKFVKGVAEVRIGTKWGTVNRAGEMFFAIRAGELE